MEVSCRDQAILSRDDLIQESAIGKQYGIKEFRFSGGEPLAIGDKLFEYADVVYDITGKKPVVLTSGFGITERWLQKARNKFASIAVSVENPLEPLQTVVNNRAILKVIRDNTSEELPLEYGLTLVTAPHFKNIETIFDVLYENIDGRFMPQLDYPCLGNFVVPTPEELHDLQRATRSLFKKYGIIPYYFVYMIGSILWLEQDINRIVLNLHPNGVYQIYDSMLERWQVEYKWLNYLRKQQLLSETCKECEWLDVCRHHPYWMLRYDWCGLRKAIFQGMYDGLGIGN